MLLINPVTFTRPLMTFFQTLLKPRLRLLCFSFIKEYVEASSHLELAIQLFSLDAILHCILLTVDESSKLICNFNTVLLFHAHECN